MTYHSYNTYEFSAFQESDLVSGNLHCGSTFTMPANAAACFSVVDNDYKLSGDNKHNENSNDKSGQQAQITVDGEEVGNGGQIYAESYYWVCDQDGNWYVMIEVEQEGTSEDYFTFFTGGGYSMPAEGAELTVVSQSNVVGEWLDYNCLDAGDKAPTNVLPVLEDDEAAVCYDDEVTVDVLANDTDANGDTLTITEVNGQAINEGQTLIFNDVSVTLDNGELVFDGSVAYADLVSGDSATDTFTYTVSDGVETATANVDVTFKGNTDTIEKIQAELPKTATVQIIQESEDVGNGTSADAFTIQFSNADGLNGVFENAYCVDFFDPIDVGGHGTSISDAPLVNANLTIATADNLTDEQAAELGAGGVNGESAVDNLDLINWIINQDFENTDNGDGNATNYSDAEIQGAIWALTNGETLESFGVPGGVFVEPGLGTSDNGQEILDLAIANGEGFVAGEGDLVGVLVDPVSPESSVQPFIVAMDLYEECVC